MNLKILIFVAGLLLSSPSWAGNPVPTLMNEWQAITTSFGENMVSSGAKLLFGLAGLQFTLNGLNAIRRGKDLNELVFHIAWSLVTVTVWFTFITESPTWFPRVLQTWNDIGGTATNTGPLDPGAIMTLGISIVETIRTTIAAKAGSSAIDLLKNVSVAFQAVFVEVFILLSFLVLAGQLALAMLRGYLWLCLGPILLGFGGLSYTKDIAINTLKAGISVGVTILTCYVIAGAAEASTAIFNQQIASFTLDNWMGLWNSVGIAALIALASWQVPKLANDMLNGGVSGGVGETMATAGVAAAGAAAMTGGVGGVLAQAAKSSTQTLGGLAQAGFAGFNAASDLGKSGMGAAGHALKEVAGHGGGVVAGSIMNMLDTSTSSLKKGMAESIGGQTAQSIQASRGGSISPSSSPSGSSPSAGTGGSTGNSVTTSQMQPNGEPSNSADSSSPGNKFSGASSSSIGPDNGAGGTTNDQLAQQLQNLADNMNKTPTTAQQLRDLTNYIPNEQQSVGVNAHLGGGQQE